MLPTYFNEPWEHLSNVPPTFRACAVDLKFKNLGYSVKMKKGKRLTVLDCLNGIFEYGKIHGILGPSGSGKTSLLNVLAGFNKVTDGSITINGETHPAKMCSEIMSAVSSYIVQHDFLVPELTIRETLEFAARLKLPKSILLSTGNKIVECLLKKLALTEIAGRHIWKLSGGQRKRVAVAVELFNYPPVIFLDEPTSGLDSTSCYRLIELLKSLASVGCNVIATIHQPNSRVFKMFDTVYVLANGGRMAYNGTPLQLTQSFKRIGVSCSISENPADILFENGNIEKLAHSLRNHPFVLEQTQEKVAIPTIDEVIKDSYFQELPHLKGTELVEYCTRQRAPAMTQFSALLHRTLLQSWRDKPYLLGRFITYTVCSVLFGAAFYDVGNEATKVMFNVSFLFLITMLPIVATSIVTVLRFPVAYKVLLRESINSWYSLSAFYITQAIVDNAIVLVTALIFPNVMWLFSCQAQWMGIAIPILSLVMSLHSVITHHFAYVISIGPNEEALPFLPFSLACINCIFSGFMISYHNMPVWIGWMQYVYYGQFTFRATMRIAFGALLPAGTPHGGDVKLPCNSPFAAIHPLCAIKRGDQVLEHLVKIYPCDGSLEQDIMALGLFYVLFFVLGWILLAVRLYLGKKAISRT